MAHPAPIAPAPPSAPDPDFDAPGPLAHIPLFASLSHHDQLALRSLMRLQSADANETIVWHGDPGDSFYLLSRGRALVTAPNDDGAHVQIAAISPGGFFGEVSLLDAGPRTATVRATEPSELLVLGRDDFHRFLRAHPDAAVEILAVMGQRQRAATEALRAAKNPNVAFDLSRVSAWQRVSDAVAALSASQWFTIAHIAWFGLWIGVNLLGSIGLIPRALAFDPYPFGLLTMIVSLEAIFLAICVLVSQNRQSEKDRLRTDLDYQTNVKAQQQITALSQQLTRIESRLNQPPP